METGRAVSDSKVEQWERGEIPNRAMKMGRKSVHRIQKHPRIKKRIR